MASTWNPDVYDRFEKLRSRPFFDLIDMVKSRAGMDVIDLGCGTGRLTRIMHERFVPRSTLGIDASESMLAKVPTRAIRGLSFVHRDITDLDEEGAYDLVISNAALQWVPDNPGILQKIRTALRPGGQVAIQVPANDDFPTHVVANEVASREPFSDALDGWQRSTHILSATAYATRLHELGFVRQAVKMLVYPQLVPSRESLVTWVRGSLLTAFERRLTEEHFEEFVEAYTRELFERIPDQRPLFYPFKRLFVWGQLPSRP